MTIKVHSGNKTGKTEYDITLEEMERVMDVHCGYIMSQTLMEKSTIYFPDGRVVEYRWDKENNCVWKREGRLKTNETN